MEETKQPDSRFHSTSLENPISFQERMVIDAVSSPCLGAWAGLICPQEPNGAEYKENSKGLERFRVCSPRTLIRPFRPADAWKPPPLIGNSGASQGSGPETN